VQVDNDSIVTISHQQERSASVFMCSPAADNVVGAAWNMDGGWTAQ
jgi:3-hydroxybutyrate dehydrogenase